MRNEKEMSQNRTFKDQEKKNKKKKPFSIFS